MRQPRSHLFDRAVVAESVATARTSQGLTHTELARRAGIGRTTLHRVEKGLPVQRSSLQAISAALEMNFDHMVQPTTTAFKGRRAYLHHDAGDSVWFGHGDVRAKIPPDNHERIQDSRERQRLGRNRLVSIFSTNPGYGLPQGPGIVLIELYDAYDGGVNPALFRHAVLFCVRGSARVTIDGGSVLLTQGSSIAYENALPMRMEPSEPVGPEELCPLLLCTGANRIGKIAEGDAHPLTPRGGRRIRRPS